jgi:cellulose synthase/poly-beta-1,6-N-acetylglucosamine synthase-like glycosyltransferase
VSYEEAAWCESYLKGKDALGLFVHLRGSCQFIRRKVLEDLGGWSEKHLSEDMEISARLTEKGFRIRYASDVCSWQESPESLAQMFRQRIRWFRGSMEVALKYGRLIRKPSLRTFDAEATLLGPFVLIVSFLSYLLAPLFFASLDGSVVLAITFGGWAALTTTFAAGAIGLLFVAKPKRKRDVMWLPFMYAYWSFQAFLATWAFLRIVFRASRTWNRTPRKGTIALAKLSLPARIELTEESLG